MIVTNTLLKNSADFIEPVLMSVYPYVDRMIVSVDNASTDGTIDILKRLVAENPKIDLNFYDVQNPNVDLVKVRNYQLKKSTEDWVWILDDDELYFPEDVEKVVKTLESDVKWDVFAFKDWHMLDFGHFNQTRGRFVERIYRNKPTLEWKGVWSREAIYDGDKWLYRKTCDEVHQFDVNCVHFSYMKKYSWRDAFGKKKFRFKRMTQEQIDSKPKLPKEISDKIISLLKKYGTI